MQRYVPIVVLLSLTVGGCRNLPRWLGGGSSAGSPHEPPPRPQSRGSASGSSSSGFRSSYEVHLSFDVIRADLPLAGVRHSKKIWNHVDELRAAPSQVALLARNGLRMGVATPKAWTALRSTLIACDAQIRTERIVPSAGLPLVLEMGRIDEPESVFTYGATGRLVGKTFNAGAKLLILSYAVRAELGGSIDLETALEIRHDRGTLTWERRGGVIRQVPAYDRHVFESLTVAHALNPGEMLVIGPSSTADNDYLVGSRFLSRHGTDGSFETVLFITPITYQVRHDQRNVE